MPCTMLAQRRLTAFKKTNKKHVCVCGCVSLCCLFLAFKFKTLSQLFWNMVLCHVLFFLRLILLFSFLFLFFLWSLCRYSEKLHLWSYAPLLLCSLEDNIHYDSFTYAKMTIICDSQFNFYPAYLSAFPTTFTIGTFH